jgi:Spy/CpxP family protein refolding chaperone
VIKKVILFNIILIILCASGLYGWPARSDKPPDHLAWQLKHGFTLADKDLFDARVILGLADKINLTELQQQKVEAIWMTYQEFSILKSAEIKIRELRLASYLKSDNIDKQEIARLIRQIGRQKTDWVVVYINYLLDLREVLNRGQADALGELVKKTKKQYPGKRKFRGKYHSQKSEVKKK